MAPVRRQQRLPTVLTAVGIAMDAHSSQTGRRGGSEDMFALRISACEHGI